MMRWVGIVACASAGAMMATLACSSFSPSTETNDGGVGEAGDAASEPVNLLSNGDFERQCAGWGASGGTLVPNADPAFVHAGKGSCLVCSSADGMSQVHAAAAVPAPAQAEFVASVWLRRAPQAAPPQNITTHIDVTLGNGVGLQQGERVQVPALTDTWQEVTSLVNVSTADGGGLYFWLIFDEPGRCYYVDDATLSRSR